MTHVLVINSGSSSIKYELFDMGARRSIAAGAVERIGERQSALEHRDAPGGGKRKQEVSAPDHRAAMQRIVETFSESGLQAVRTSLAAIGHRVVHGGSRFREPVRITAAVIEQIRELTPLAPLHNPANVIGMEVSLQLFPDVPQVAVFDTAFHQTIPPHAFHYALPQEFFQRYQVRRYGFHGTSHGYVAKQAAAFLNRPLESLKLISLHLGNGASAAAIDGGRCIDTSMGLTPLEGLIMGTRSGDLDPAILPYLARNAGLSMDQLDELLNKRSGLKGICGANDMREVLRLSNSGDQAAALAIDMYAYRIKKYIGAYLAALGGLDALIFTAGIGENSTEIRARACMGLERLGIAIDPRKNEAAAHGPRAIHTDRSPIQVLVVPTDEEWEIAEQALEQANPNANSVAIRQ
jgi:acetate kinase